MATFTLDLRSDTVTRPTAAMLAAMSAAEVGDDVYEEDPSIKALEADVAKCLGKEAALFVPSGTMANTIGILLHTSPGDAVIVEAGAHCLEYEAGAASALGGVLFRSFSGDDHLRHALAGEYRGPGVHFAETKLLVVENTHNLAGGVAKSRAELAVYQEFAAERGLKVHCDGARLWNAAALLEVPEAELVRFCDTVSVCFSKGLGAPVGSALVGSEDLISGARKWRKRLGGGMRQAGYLAAAARYGLHHHRARLAEDHRRAARFAALLQTELGALFRVRYPERATNMVYLETLQASAAAVRQHLASSGILVNATGERMLRVVFHLDSEVAELEALVQAFRHQ